MVQQHTIRIIAVFMAVILLAGCSFPTESFHDEVAKEDIIAYVKANQQELQMFPVENFPADRDSRSIFIKDFLGDDTIVKDIYVYEEYGVIRFCCGGTGLSTLSTYSGFYYSEEDTPFAMEFKHVLLEEMEPGVFYLEFENGTHSFYTVRIVEKWFYYYMVWK